MRPPTDVYAQAESPRWETGLCRLVVAILTGRDAPEASGMDGARSLLLGGFEPATASIGADILPLARVVHAERGQEGRCPDLGHSPGWSNFDWQNFYWCMCEMETSMRVSIGT